MSNLRATAKLITELQSLPRMMTVFSRAIRTTAPKPTPNNNHTQLSMPNGQTLHTEISRMFAEPRLPSDNNSNQIDDHNAGETEGIAAPNLPKPIRESNEIPAMNIVDIRGGYGHMNFDERMEHMDLVERMNESQLPSKVVNSLTIPDTIVNVDAFGNEMMYEEKPEAEEEEIFAEELSSTPTAATTQTVVTTQTTTATTAAELEDEKEFVLSDNAPLPLAQAEQQMDEATARSTEQPLPNVDATVQTSSAAENNTIETGNDTIITKNNVCIAPTDIDGFADEEETKQGTVDIDPFGESERPKLPPIPKERNNVFKFKGIKIIMPKHRLRDETYRYRLDAADQDKPDDIQICVFEK